MDPIVVSILLLCSLFVAVVIWVDRRIDNIEVRVLKQLIEMYGDISEVVSADAAADDQTLSDLKELKNEFEEFFLHAALNFQALNFELEDLLGREIMSPKEVRARVTNTLLTDLAKEFGKEAIVKPFEGGFAGIIPGLGPEEVAKILDRLDEEGVPLEMLDTPDSPEGLEDE